MDSLPSRLSRARFAASMSWTIFEMSKSAASSKSLVSVIVMIVGCEGGREGWERKETKEGMERKKKRGRKKKKRRHQASSFPFLCFPLLLLSLSTACMRALSVHSPILLFAALPPIVSYSSIDHVPQPTVEGPSIQAGRSDARDGFVPLGMCFVSLFSTECPWLNCPFSHPSEQLKKEAVHSVGQFTDAVADTLSNR